MDAFSSQDQPNSDTAMPLTEESTPRYSVAMLFRVFDNRNSSGSTHLHGTPAGTAPSARPGAARNRLGARRFRPLAAAVAALLLFHPWTGPAPAYSRGDPQVPPVEGDAPGPQAPTRMPSSSAPPPDASLPVETRQEIQRSLRQLGFYAGGIDGRFGEQTRAAIRDYQRSIGARPTGVLTAQETAQLLQPPPRTPAGSGPGAGCAGPRTGAG